VFFLNWLENNVGILRIVIDRIVPLLSIFLPLEAVNEAAVYEGAFFGGVIVVGKAV